MAQNRENHLLASLELLEAGNLFPERRQQPGSAIQDRRQHPQSGAGSSDRIAGMLESVHMFKDLEWAHIKSLADYIQVYRAPPGAVLFREGDKGDFMCVLLEGKLEVHKEDNRRVDKVVTTIYPGRSLGEMTIVDGEPRSATAVAVTSSTLAVLTQANFMQIMRDKPALSAKLLFKIAQLLSQRLRMTSGMLVDYLEN
jgi:CRP-like cAMP-binding protein